MKGHDGTGARLDPQPLLDWIDANPGCMEGWGYKQDHRRPKQVKTTELMRARATAVRRVNGMRKKYYTAAYGVVAEDQSRKPRASFTTLDWICCLLNVHMYEVFGRVYWEVRCEPLSVTLASDYQPLEVDLDVAA